jgi:hypothetical protein
LDIVPPEYGTFDCCEEGWFNRAFADSGKGKIELAPHGPARRSAWQKFVASLSQIPPIGPVLPTLPVYKSFAVYNLARDSFHGMEEVIGSIPIRSTNKSFKFMYLRR